MARITKAPEERRSELIACAQTLFYSKGYESTSVNDIVTEVGVAKGTFYHYFDSKQAVLEAMIEHLLEQSMVLLETVAADDSLDALTKLTRIFNVMGNWKTERKAELLAVTRVMYLDENVLLLHKFKLLSVTAVAPILAKVIQQGVAEGVFQTEFVQEAAEIFLHTAQAFSEAFAHILLHAEEYQDPAAIVRQKKMAYEAALERILGASPGSLPLFDPAIIDAWFA